MIQIRHVPRTCTGKLRERAKRQGMSDYLLQEIMLLSTQSSWEELDARTLRDVPPE